MAFSAAGRSRPERCPSVRRPCEAMACLSASVHLAGSLRRHSCHHTQAQDSCCSLSPSSPGRPHPAGACLACEPCAQPAPQISPSMQGAAETPVGEVGDADVAGRQRPHCMCDLGSISTFRGAACTSHCLGG